MNRSESQMNRSNRLRQAQKETKSTQNKNPLNEINQSEKGVRILSLSLPPKRQREVVRD